MNSENPSAPGVSLARASSATDKKIEKKFQLTLEAGHCGSAVVLHCQGRVIFHREARAVATIVAEVLPSAHRMVVDLGGIDAIDSGGLGELVLTHMWAEASGYSLKFASAKRPVRHLFEITNLVSVLDMYTSVPEAIAAMVSEEIHSA
jgi:anti-sigma B factor antagonist